MAETKKVRILRRVGHPRGGVILAPGAIADLPEVWADRYIANGSAALVETKPSEPKAPATGKKKGK